MSEVSLPWNVTAHLILRVMESHLPEPHGAEMSWNEYTASVFLSLAHGEAASVRQNWVVVISATLEPCEQRHGQSDHSSMTRRKDNYSETRNK